MAKMKVKSTKERGKNTKVIKNAKKKQELSEARKRRIRKFVLEGVAQGFVTQDEVLELFPDAEDHLEELDDLYDELSEQDRQMMEAAGGEDAMSTAGIYIDLKNGDQTIAKVDPDVMNRMLAVVNMDEFNAFIECIVQSVETPEVSPLCKQ